MFGLKIFVQVQTFQRGPPHAPAQLLPPCLKDYHLWARATQRLLQSSQNIHPLSSGKDQGSKGIYRIWGPTMGLCNHLFKSIKHLDKICLTQHWGGVCSEPCDCYEMEIRPASVFQFTFLARINISTLKGVKRGNRIGDRTMARGPDDRAWWVRWQF